MRLHRSFSSHRLRLCTLIVSAACLYTPLTASAAEPTLDPLTAAVHQGNGAAVSTLLQQGAAINVTDAYGQTPLMYAVRNGNLPMVKQLLIAGANPNVVNAYRMTPLKLSYYNGTPHISRELLQRGATSQSFSIDEWRALNAQVGDVGTPPQTVQEIVPKDTPGRIVHQPPAQEITRFADIPTVALIAGGTAAVAGIAIIATDNGSNDTATQTETPSDTTNDTPSSPPSSTEQSDYETDEYNAQAGLAQINASAAYARGATGTGVTVAVIDSGVDLTHPDLDTNIAANGTDLLSIQGDGSALGEGEAFSHGTNVAGIIAAKKDDSEMHGVAPDAKILAIRAAESDGILDTSRLSEAFAYARTQNVQIVNASYGSTSVSTGDPFLSRQSLSDSIGDQVSAYQMNVAANMVHVFAAGNEGNAQVSLEAGMPYYFPELQPLWLAVASVDSNNTLSSFSNSCGLAANWCLVAPGENIYTTSAVEDTVQTGNHASVLGTSFAAPHVAGAVAVLMDAFPTLTPQQVVQLLLTTATDLGDPGVDAVYGYGLVNLDAATQPQGDPTVSFGTTLSALSAPLSQSRLQLSAPFGDALQQTDATLMVLDRFQRPYMMKVAELSSTQDDSAKHSRSFSAFNTPRYDHTTALGEDIQLSYSTENTQRLNEAPTSDAAMPGRYHMQASFGEQQMHGYHNVGMDEAFALATHEDYAAHHRIGSNTLANPYLAMVDSGTGLVHHMPLSPDIGVQFGSFNGDIEDDTDSSGAHGVVAQLTYRPVSRLTIGLQLGSMSERSTFLGARTDGAFALDDNARTVFYGLAAAWEATGDLTLHGSYMMGNSRISAGQHSVFSSLSDVSSDSFSVGATLDNAGGEDHLAGIALTQPLRITSADATLNLPVARTLDGRIIRDSQQLDLTPQGRELDLESFYVLPLEDDTDVTLGGMLRFEPDHHEQAKPDGLFMIKYNRSF